MILRRIFDETKVSIFCICFLVPFMVSLIPVYFLNLLLRSCVWTLAKIFRPDLDGFVSGLHATYALNISNKATVNILLSPVVDGHISLEEIRNCAYETVFKIGKYPLLERTWTGFLGWAFWKIDQDFDYRNHIRDYDHTGRLALPNPCSEEDLNTVLGRLFQAPWDRSRSPWEFLRIPNYVKDGKEYTAMVFRLDHVLCDGYSILEMIKTATNCVFPVPTMSLAEKKFSTWQKLGLLLKSPYDVSKNLMKLGASVLPQQNKLTEEIVSLSPIIDVEAMKSIKNHFGVYYSTVVYAAISGAVERALKRSGQKVPKQLLMGIVLPKPNHPGGMTAHFCILLGEVPIASACPIERLHKIQRIFEELSESTAPIAYTPLTLLASQFCMAARRLVIKMILGSGITIGVTNFPVTTAPDFYEGHEILELTSGMSTIGPVGLMISTGGVNNKQRLNFNVSKGLFASQEAIRNLGAYAAEELQLLLDAML